MCYSEYFQWTNTVPAPTPTPCQSVGNTAEYYETSDITIRLVFIISES